jgi:hypothetical protein
MREILTVRLGHCLPLWTGNNHQKIMHPEKLSSHRFVSCELRKGTAVSKGWVRRSLRVTEPGCDGMPTRLPVRANVRL